VSVNPADLTDIQLLRHWKEKALVCVCRDPGGSPYRCGGSPGEWCGPQRQAEHALREIHRRNLPLPRGWRVALSEDDSCGRRKHGTPTEFDELMNAYVAGLEAALGTRH
jgi:hypothetical protein